MPENHSEPTGPAVRRSEDQVPSTGRAGLSSLFGSAKVAAAARTGNGGGATRPAAEYGPLVDQVVDRVLRKQGWLERQRTEAPQLLQELLRHPKERRRVLVRNSQRFRSWALCDLLLEESLKSGFHHPVEAVELAELAIEVSGQLEDATFGAAIVSDLKARSWTYLANSRRIGGEYRAASEAFRVAEALLEQGTGDLLERARFFAFKATLYSDLSQYDASLKLFDRAIHIYRRSGEKQLLGQALIRKGLHCGYAGDPEAAIELLRRGLELVDTRQEPRLALAAHHNLILNLNDLGRHEEAAELLEASRPLYQQLGERINLMRLRWLEARLACSRHQLQEAESALHEVREAFIEQSLPHEAALVSLELASLYLEQGRTAEIKHLAEELFGIFQSIDLHRGAFAALILFEKCAQLETVTLALIQDTMTTLARLRRL